MENREMHQLQKQYILETNHYLSILKQGLSGEQLIKQKEKIKELSRLLDQRYQGTTDPASNLKRRHE